MGDRDVHLDDLLEAVAERIAEKLAARLAENGSAVVKPRLLTVEQAAVYLGRSKEAVQHMVSSGKLAVVRSDRRVFLDRSDLDLWIEANKQAGLL